MMNYKFYLVCPKCGADNEYISDYSDPPRMQCADCLLDRVEIVQMSVVAAEQLPVLSQ